MGVGWLGLAFFFVDGLDIACVTLSWLGIVSRREACNVNVKTTVFRVDVQDAKKRKMQIVLWSIKVLPRASS
jgi:hypothetical protein